MSTRSGTRTHRALSKTISATALALAAVYSVPHIWWMFGVSTGFPGDASELDAAFERTWFVIYNLISTGLVLLGSGMVIALEGGWIPGWRRTLWALVLVGASALILRGALGVATMIPDPGSATAVVWELWFLLTGSLFAIVAWRHQR